MTQLEEIALNIDELYHEDAAKKMKISRQTFGRILQNAHKKVAECLLKGKALKIETSQKEE